jgi:lipopolysaccharide biosynthesis glycosyltransferase
MSIIPIAFCFDANLVMPAGVCITSLLKNADIDTFYDIYILHSAIGDKDLKKIAELIDIYRNCNITFISVQDQFSTAYQVRGITTLTYFRLLIPQLIVKYDKILYSDVDVIFRSDLTEYYNVDLGDNYFGAVDVVTPLRPDIKNYMEKVLQIDSSMGYFLAGNLVINSKKLREDNMVEKFIEMSRNDYHFQDMDIINISCQGKFTPIPLSYCLTNYFYTLINIQREKLEKFVSKKDIDKAIKTGIIHYNGSKPWNSTCYGQDIWWAYYRDSIFYEETFCYEFYTKLITETDRWNLKKRFKHLLSYFRT